MSAAARRPRGIGRPEILPGSVEGDGTPAERLTNSSRLLFALVLAACIVGLPFIFIASATSSVQTTGNAYSTVARHSFYLLIGLVAMGASFQIPRALQRRWALPFLWATIALLGVAWAQPIIGPGGARRWIQLGPVTVRASSFAALAILVYAAHTLAVISKHREPDWPKRLLPILPALGMLALVQEVSIAVLLLVALFSLAYVCGAFRSMWVAMITSVILGMAGLVVTLEPYRMNRFVTAMDPWGDPLGSGYQVVQSLIALGSGGFLGRGTGSAALPEAASDFLLSTVGSVFGFLGVSLVLGLLVAICLVMLDAARGIGDHYSRNLAAGAALLIGLQTLANAGSVSGVFPVTGAGLPLVSYSGSGVVVQLALVGLVMRVVSEDTVRITPLREAYARLVLRVARTIGIPAHGVAMATSVLNPESSVSEPLRLRAIEWLTTQFDDSPSLVSTAAMTLDQSIMTPTELMAISELNEKILRRDPEKFIHLAERAWRNPAWDAGPNEDALEMMERTRPSQILALYRSRASSDFVSLLKDSLDYNQGPVAPGSAVGDPQIEQMIGSILRKKSGTIVDFGAGSGRLVQGLLSLSKSLSEFHYVGVEATREKRDRLERFCQRSGFAGMVQRCECLTLEEFESARLKSDSTFLVNVLHEVPLRDIPRMFEAIVRNLGVGGSILIHDMMRLPKGEPRFVTWDSIAIETLFQDSCFDVKIREHSTRKRLPLITAVIELKKAPSLDLQAIGDRVLRIYKQRKARVLKQIREMEESARVSDSEIDEDSILDFLFLQSLNTNIDTQIAAYEEQPLG